MHTAATATDTTTRPRHRLAAVLAGLLAALALVASACSDDEGTVVAGGTATTKGSTDTTDPGGQPGYEHPTGADEVVVSVFEGGGFVPVEMAIATVPAYTLLGDGTAVEAGAVIAIYPGPAIQPLVATLLDEAAIQAVLASADEAGLFTDDVDYGEPGIADASTTTVTIAVDGATYTHSAYALGFDDFGDHLTREQEKARRALSEFVASLSPPDGPAGEPYTPTGVIVHTLGAYQSPDPTVPQEPVTWPLAEAPAPIPDLPFQGCIEVTGADAETLLATLAEANQASPWVVEGVEGQLALAFRPLVPGDRGCS